MIDKKLVLFGTNIPIEQNKMETKIIEFISRLVIIDLMFINKKYFLSSFFKEKGKIKQKNEAITIPAVFGDVNKVKILS